MRILLGLLKNQQGFGMTQALMGAAAVGGIAVAMLSLNEVQQKQIRANRAISTRDNLRNLIERYLLDSQVLYASTGFTGTNNAGNLALKACLPKKAGDPPLTCGSPATENCCVHTSTPQPFVLIDPATPGGTTPFAGTDAASGTALSTTPSAPARFDIEGSPCAAPSAACPFEIVTSFHAVCDPVVAQCKTPKTLQIEYAIRPANGFEIIGGTRIKPITRKIPVSANGTFTLNAPSGGGGSGSGSGSGSGLAFQVQEFKTPGNYTFTVPPNVKSVWVTLVGGGGGGDYRADSKPPSTAGGSSKFGTYLTAPGGSTGGGAANARGVSATRDATGSGYYSNAVYSQVYFDPNLKQTVYPGQLGGCISYSPFAGASAVVGYGGGGAGQNYNYNCYSPGGGASAFIDAPLNVTPGESIAITVGAGGFRGGQSGYCLVRWLE